MKTFQFLIYGGLLFQTATQASPAPSPLLLDQKLFDQVRQEAQQNHPALDSAKARIAAASAGKDTLRRWEAPTVGVSLTGFDVAKRRDDGDVTLSLEQALPRSGLYKAQAAQADSLRALREGEMAQTSTQLGSIAVKALLELAWFDESIALDNAQIDWIGVMVSTAKSQTARPGTAPLDALRLESTLLERRTSRDVALIERRGMAERLNLLLGRPEGAPWPSLALPAAPSPPEESIILVRMETANPVLRVLELETSAAHASVKVANHASDPFFSVFADARAYSGGDFREATLGVKVTLPWFNDQSYAAERTRARQERTAAEAARMAEARRLRGELRALLTSLEAKSRESGLIESETLPAAILTARAAETAWGSGQVGLLEVMEARKAVLEASKNARRLNAALHLDLESLRQLAPGPDTTSATK